MKFILIVGPPAVGKMTVGKVLADRTGYRLFHNHLSIELVRNFFEFGERGFSELDRRIRFTIFEEVAKSDLPGLIFTLVWAFNLTEDAEYVDQILGIFRRQGHPCYIVELRAHRDERLQRNRHPARLAEKPSKRDVEWSEEALLQWDSEYRLNSKPDEYPDKPRLVIDNTHLSPEEVATKIQQAFDL